jgi:Protein of unknown function (DUF3052)
VGSEAGAQPGEHARTPCGGAAGELVPASLAEHVRVARARDLEMRVRVVHAHKTRRGRAIFPPVQKDYSDTPLPQKLGIKEGSRVALQGAPKGFDDVIGVQPRMRGQLDVIVLFQTKKGELTRAFTPLARRLTSSGGLWVAWPKKTAALDTDLSFETVQGVGLEAGLVDNKSCSIDDTWQALRFVYRREDRP